MLMSLLILGGTIIAWAVGLAFIVGMFTLAAVVTVNPWVGYPLVIGALVLMGMGIQWYTDRKLQIGG